jgi:hypothetical protein
MHNEHTENINIIDNYVRKWDATVFSTKPINREKTKTSILNAYNIAGKFTPDIYFLTSTSPQQSLILKRILSKTGSYFILKRTLLDILQVGIQRTKSNANKFSELFLAEIPYISARSEKFEKVCNLLYEPNIYDSICRKILAYELSLTNLWIYNLYIDCVNTNCNLQIWNTLNSLCEECQYLLTFDRFCIVIERPNNLYLDSEQRPHAEGKAAITFADGYEIYCNHGTKIPAKYGKFSPSNWQSKWVLSEDNSLGNRDYSESREITIALLAEIGYKKFSQELPEIRDRYWQKDGKSRYPSLIDYAIDNVIVEWQRFYYYDYYKGGGDIDWQIEKWNKFSSDREIDRAFPCKISDELSILYLIYRGDYQLAPRLHFYPLEEAIENPTPGLENYPVRLFHGDRQEIYYVLCDNEERMISHVYCQFPGEEPVIYAECVTSLIVTIAQCYQEGAYYIAIDEETGERTIEQDLDKIEPIFEKFNPDQIDTWRKIWKGD